MITAYFPPATAAARVRSLQWRARSLVPLTWVLALADRVREAMSLRLGVELEVLAHQPIGLEATMVNELLADGVTYEWEGTSGLGWLFLTRDSARRMLGANNGVGELWHSLPLTQLELDMLTVVLADLCRCLHDIGGDQIRLRPAPSSYALERGSSLVSLHIGKPWEVEIGVILARDPVADSGAKLSEQALDDVELTVRAIAGSIRLTCAELVALDIGAVLPMSREGQAHLVIDQTRIARGACGVTGGRLAFRIGTSHESQGA